MATAAFEAVVGSQLVLTLYGQHVTQMRAVCCGPEMGLCTDGGITFTKVTSVNASSPAGVRKAVHPL